MKSAQNRTIQSMVKTKWETEWKTGKENARRLRSMSRFPGSCRGLKLYGSLERKHIVLISRLRTGHCHLNQYLHRFNIIETAECECGAERETVEHYLLNCELYEEERDALRRRVRRERKGSYIFRFLKFTCRFQINDGNMKELANLSDKYMIDSLQKDL